MVIDLEPLLEPILHHLSSLRPEWNVVEACIRGRVPQRYWRRAWMVVALEWVERMNAPFGGRYHVRHHDDNWALWLPRSGVPEDALLTYVARAWTRARASLVSIAEPEPSKPLIILLFDDHDDYYRYLSEFYPEGEWGSSSGVLVRDGFPHIALAPNTVAGLEQAIAHELGHLCLVGLELPQWLDEGLADLSRDTFDSRAHIPMDARRAEATRDVWHRNGLDDFWSGSAFHRADEMQQASYALADIITRSIASTHAARLASFVRDARCDDHGEASARKHLGTTLSDIAGRFLGPGEWSPPGVRLATKMREAYSLVREGRYTDALAAYEAVLTRAPKHPLASNNLAWLLATSPDDRSRNGSRALTLARAACESTTSPPWYYLGTLAAAHAECGDFAEARELALRSMSLAPETERSGCLLRLACYQAERPHRESPASDRSR